MLFQQCATSTQSNDLHLKDSLCLQLENVLSSAENALQILQSFRYEEDVEYLRQICIHGNEYHRVLLSSLNTCSVTSSTISPQQHVLHTGTKGRPRLIVNIEQVELLRSSGFTSEEVAQILGISRTTCWRRFQELGIPLCKYTDISDHDLDLQVRDIQSNNPNIGVSMLQGYLKSQGVIVQRCRARESALRTNPIRALTRWQQVVSRRSYSVPGPNSLWHVDGHHSLIRWRFVIRGCIDGFSRMVTFLSCNTNNRAETVFQLFRKATMEFGVPSRVRSDKGGENISICHFMVSYRGVGRGSHIAGSSVHNQRIERLWRDVYRCVCCSFHEVFYFLEAQGVLDPDNEYDLFVLHCVFLPVVNHLLQAYARAWNQHPVRTERNWSPHKIWVNGIIDPARRNLTAVTDVVNGALVTEELGIDEEGPLPDEQIHTVDVPETLCPLSDSSAQLFLDSLPETVSIDEAVAVYMQARNHLYQLM